MEITFPDTEKALKELLEPFGATYLHLVYGWEELGLPAFHIYQVGGNQALVFRSDRIVVHSYAEGRDAAKQAASQAHELLVPGPHGTSHGLIDSIDVESVPHLMPYTSDTVNLFGAIYRVNTRPL